MMSPGIRGFNDVGTVCAGILIGVLILSGCHREREPTGLGRDAAESGVPPASAPAASAQAARSEAAAENPATGVTVRIVVLEAAENQPLPAVKLSLLVQTASDPRAIEVHELWTDSDGAAEMVLSRVVRAAAISEFCTRPREIPLVAGDQAGRLILEVNRAYRAGGQVVDDRGQPLAGAEVLLCRLQREPRSQGFASIPLPGEGESTAEFEKRWHHDLAGTCLTDDSGRFQVDVESPRPLAIAAFHEGFSAAGWRLLAFDEESGAFEPVSIELFPGATLRVHFMSVLGSSVEHQPLQVRETAVSERHRKYSQNLLFSFGHTGFTDNEGMLTFTVPARIALGLFSNPTGRELALFPRLESSGAERDFRLEIPLGELRLEPGQMLEVVATPARKVRLECAVRNADGGAISGATIDLVFRQVTTGGDGVVALLVPCDAGAGLQYRVSAEGYRPVESVQPPPSRAEGARVRLDVVLEESRRLEVDAGGPVRGIWLVAERGSLPEGKPESGYEPLLLERALRTPVTSAGNSWFFEEPDETSFSLLVQRERFAFSWIRGLPVAGGTDAIRLDARTSGAAGALLKGRVVYPEGMRPQSASLVLMRNDDAGIRRFDPAGIRGAGMGWIALPLGGRGEFEIAGLAPGRYALGAALIEWGRRTDIYGEVVVAEECDEKTVELALAGSPGELECVLTDASGAPLGGVELLLFDPVDSPLAASLSLATRFVSDGAGEIAISHLPPGRYGFEISGESWPEVLHAGRVLIQSGETTRIVIVAPGK